jgi:hypothetical protein
MEMLLLPDAMYASLILTKNLNKKLRLKYYKWDLGHLRAFLG